MSDRVLIPLPGIGTLSLSRAEYETALIPVARPEIAKPLPISAPAPANPPLPQRGLHYIRLREVCARVSLRPSTLYNMIRMGRFPKQVKLSERTSVWSEAEVEAFMNARIAERDRHPSVNVQPSSRYMRMGEVMKRTGLNHSMIYGGVRNGTFPRWADLPKRASEWLRSDIEGWLSTRSRRNSVR
jgi:prophage regulatory protein